MTLIIVSLLAITFPLLQITLYVAVTLIVQSIYMISM